APYVEKAKDAAADVAEKAAPYVEKAKDAATDAVEKIKESVSGAEDAVADRADDVADAADDARDAAADAAGEAKDAAADAVEEVEDAAADAGDGRGRTGPARAGRGAPGRPARLGHSRHERPCPRVAGGGARHHLVRRRCARLPHPGAHPRRGLQGDTRPGQSQVQPVRRPAAPERSGRREHAYLLRGRGRPLTGDRDQRRQAGDLRRVRGAVRPGR